jgi:hypothetical protein
MRDLTALFAGATLTVADAASADPYWRRQAATNALFVSPDALMAALCAAYSAAHWVAVFFLTSIAGSSAGVERNRGSVQPCPIPDALEEDVLVAAEPANAKVGTATIARARNRWVMTRSRSRPDRPGLTVIEPRY